MSVIERLERGLAFLQAHAWGQGADKQACTDSPDGFSYCARGALIYGGFSDVTEFIWCPDRSDWHKGACVEDEDCCGNGEYAVPPEWDGAMEALDDGATDLEGRWAISVEYNDAMGRTKEEIVGLFEAAIERAKGDE